MTLSESGFRGVVWLDRDGTIVDDPGYLDDPQKLVLLDDTSEAISALNRARVAVVLITNQSGIARGKMSRETVDAIHDELRRQLDQQDARLDGVYLCPHLPADLMASPEGACDCRKPRPGLVARARRELELEGLPALVVGDKLADLELAATLSIPSLLVLTGEGQKTQKELSARGEEAGHSAPNLFEGIPWILRQLGIDE